MKLLKLRFENLNSLEGKTEIDFESGPLANTGLFVISGPTGAGKSTILDALSLALFHQTPRLGKVGGAGVDGLSPLMTRGKATMHAEVEFLINGDRYLARWEQSTARQKVGERLQTPKSRLECNGKILTEKLKEKEDHLEALLGLDFDRFTRSVLLAQGGFSAFLLAEKGRADLLAKLTGTQIYEQLSQKAYEQHDLIKKQRDELKVRLDAFKCLSEEEREQMSAEQQQHQAQLEAARSQAEALDKALHAYVSRRADEAQHARLFDQQAELEAQAEAKQADLARLLGHQAALAGQPLHTAMLEAQTSLSTKRQALPALVSTHSERAEAYRQYTLGCGQAALHQHQASQQRLSELTHTLTTLKAQQAQALTRFSALEAELPTWQAAFKGLNQAQSQQSTLTARLTQQRTLASETQAALAPKEATLASQMQRVEQAQAAWMEAQAQAEAHPQDSQGLSTFSQRLEGLKQLHAQLTGTLQKQRVQVGRQAEDLARQSTLSQAQAALVQSQASVQQQEHTLTLLQEHVEQARRIQSLEAHRSALKEGEACPLCGSCEHPYREQGTEALVPDRESELKALQKVVKKAQKALEAEGAKVSALEAEHQSESKHTRQLEEELKGLQQALEQSAVALQLELSLLQSSEAFAPVVQAAQSDLEAAQAKQRQAEALAKAATQAGQHYQSQQTQLRTLQDELSAQQQALRTLQDELQQLSQQLSQQTQHCEQAQAELLAALAQQGWALTDGDTLEAHLAALTRQLADWKAQGQALSELQRQYEQQQLALSKALDLHTLWQERCEQLAPGTWQELQPAPGPIDEKLWLKHQALVRDASVDQQALEQTLTQLEALAQEALSRWERWLSEGAWQSQSDWEGAVLSDEAARTLSEQLEAYREACQRVRLSLAELTPRLALPLPDTRPEPELRTLREQAREAIEQHAQSLGALQSRLAEDQTRREGLAQDQAQFLALDADYEWARRLNTLIGSRNGERFSKFAQSLTLRHLTGLANAHLSLLQPRYSLDVAKQGELELDIIDLYQGEARRPVKTLSGGESFLVSLALALALGELMAQRIQMQSLFLDEGFGTLSPDALEDALQVLDRLQATGRCVGLITHVEAVKQRVSTIIEVRPRSGGLSTVVVPS